MAMRHALEASRNEIDDEDSSLQRAMEMSLRSAPLPSNAPVDVIGGCWWSTAALWFEQPDSETSKLPLSHELGVNEVSEQANE